MAVKLPPAEDKLLAPPAASVPASPKKKTRGERAKGNAPPVVSPVKPALVGGMGFAIKGAAARAAGKDAPAQKPAEDEPRNPVPEVVVEDVIADKKPAKDSAKEVAVPEDLVDWGAPLSGRSWADDDDDSF